MKITTINQAMDFIYGTTWKGSVLGLSRIEELLRLMGDPQKKLKFVHIAGTNGKGSTAAMLASILAEAGYKTGLYTSPYIEHFGEMIQINGKPVSDAELISHTAFMQPLAAQMSDAPTEYEIITALAFQHFQRENCGIVVLEVGLGGRLDSTNVIPTPEVAIITAIGLDHMAQLGNTVEKIAGEKAGIIKKNGAVVCHPQISSVENVIREKCAEMNSSVIFADSGAISPTECETDGQNFSYKMHKNLRIPLLGEHQLRNAAVALETIEILRSRGWKISESALKNGLRNTQWQCRFEIICKSPTVIVDVAHNPQGIQVTLSTLEAVCNGAKPIFIFGVLEDKDYEKMAQLLIPHAEKFFLVTPENPRALPASTLEKCIRAASPHADITVCESLQQSVKLATQSATPNDVICALGSLSMIGAIRALAVTETRPKTAR
ncbi:MAG: bifunctional folylpolyglutamate synthase/dihydrofolate synthase [Defluviitaleaceae bacterium]|nr:bifunctional folylpolyglutamate synthase/dihydrofolate synthase [Defluviitaleaceae bacterium]MCL2263532.1 bifunctional folylpolyglutamate synthase/dihydrofolate synthase [Defluviitaleaceae bacterium]